MIFVLLLTSCGDDGGGTRDSGAMPDVPPLCTMDPDETCGACFAHIGTCCYEDETIGGDVPALTASCEREPSCLRCCSECVAMDCATLHENGSCPNDIPGD